MLSSCVSVPTTWPCFSQMISLKSNGKLWLVFSARALTDRLFPTVNILVSLLFGDSLIWWGKCLNKDKETVNCFKSCRGKNVQALVGQLLPPVPCISSTAWSWEQTRWSVRGYVHLDIHTKHGCLTSVECLSVRTRTVWGGLMSISQWYFPLPPQTSALNVPLG